MNSPQVIMSPFHYAAMLGVKIRYHRKKRLEELDTIAHRRWRMYGRPRLFCITIPWDCTTAIRP